MLGALKGDNKISSSSVWTLDGTESWRETIPGVADVTLVRVSAVPGRLRLDGDGEYARNRLLPERAPISSVFEPFMIK